jgi:flagellar basal-body rod protein FlgG
MSSKGIYSAISGAMAQSSRLDTIANNLANVNTNGFKKDRQVFSEYLSAYEKPDDLIRAPRVPASIESFYDMNGGDNAYVNPAGSYTNFEQGGLRATGSPLDFALDGKGFLRSLLRKACVGPATAAPNSTLKGVWSLVKAIRSSRKAREIRRRELAP